MPCEFSRSLVECESLTSFQGQLQFCFYSRRAYPADKLANIRKEINMTFNNNTNNSTSTCSNNSKKFNQSDAANPTNQKENQVLHMINIYVTQ